jgi:hypothetical protein
MTLIDAPAYDPRPDKIKRNIFIGSLIFIALAIVIGMGGYVAGHGWFFSNIPAEHKVDRFLDALEAKNYPAAYNIYTNGHPDSGYPISRFTEDWTTYSPVKGPITSHRVEISKTDGTGAFGSGIIVAVHLNNLPTCTFLYVLRADGTMTIALHDIVYHACNNDA